MSELSGLGSDKLYGRAGNDILYPMVGRRRHPNART